MIGTKSAKNITTYLWANFSPFKSTRSAVITAQLGFMAAGYVTQVILAKHLLPAADFATFQLFNFATNFLVLFAGGSIGAILAREVASHDNQTIRLRWFRDTSFAVLIITIAELLISIPLLFEPETGRSLVVLAVVHTLTHGLFTGGLMYALATRRPTAYLLGYLGLGIVKNILFLILAANHVPVVWVAGSVIIVQVVFATLIVARMQSSPSSLALASRSRSSPSSLDEVSSSISSAHRIRSILKENLDLIVANMPVFGISNLTGILAYFKAGRDLSDFNLLALVFPWSMLAYYIISALSNVLVVEVASHPTEYKLQSLLKKVFLASLALSLAAAIAAVVVLSALFPNQLNFLFTLVFVSALPTGVALSLISVLVAVFVAQNRIQQLRPYLLGLLVCYLFGTVLVSNILELLILLNIAYVAMFALLYLRLRFKRNVAAA